MEQNQPIIIERIYNSTIYEVWEALTDKEKMKKWYFELNEFKPQIGFKFQFMGGTDDGVQYLHLCEVIEVIKNKKLVYSWQYDGFKGISFVTFELFEQNDKTLLRLTHKGLESFPNENLDFRKNSFMEGWTFILNTSLYNYLENNSK